MDFQRISFFSKILVCSQDPSQTCRLAATIWEGRSAAGFWVADKAFRACLLRFPAYDRNWRARGSRAYGCASRWCFDRLRFRWNLSCWWHGPQSDNAIQTWVIFLVISSDVKIIKSVLSCLVFTIYTGCSMILLSSMQFYCTRYLQRFLLCWIEPWDDKD